MITITASATGGDFESRQLSVFLATALMVDIGTHTKLHGQRQGRPQGVLVLGASQRLQWPTCRRCSIVFGSYTLSMHKESKLRPLLETTGVVNHSQTKKPRTLISHRCSTSSVLSRSFTVRAVSVHTLTSALSWRPKTRPKVSALCCTFSVEPVAQSCATSEWLQKED